MRSRLGSRSSIVVCALLYACNGAGSDGESTDAGHDAGPVFDAGSDAARNMVQPGALCERLSTIQCAGESFCCDAPGRDYAACKKQMKDGCVKQLHLDAIAKDPTTGFDAERAAAAFAGFEALAAKCDESVTAWGNSTDGLRGILAGTVAAGKNCAPNGAAADPVIAGAALSSCADPSLHACQPRGTQKAGKLDWTCDARSKVNGPCFSDANCQEGLYCANPQNRLGAKCLDRKAVGKPCNNANECSSLFCKNNECVAADRQAAYCLN